MQDLDHRLICLVLILTTTTCVVLAEVYDKFSRNDGDLKLIDGPNSMAGTVLIFRGYGWGKICDDHWTLKEANVVCRQLGMGHALEAYKLNKFGSRISLDYLLDQVTCTGKEERLLDCQSNGWGKHNCKAHEEAGVKCSEVAPVLKKPAWNPLNLPMEQTQLEQLEKAKVSLVRPNPISQQPAGVKATWPVIVQVDGSNRRGAVCPDYFHAAEAIVFCRQLGFGIGGEVVNMPFEIAGLSEANTVAIIGRCYGNESRLDQCKVYGDANGIECASSDTVGVRCVDALPDLVPDIYSLETSGYLQRMSLWSLQCAIEEFCLPESVYRIIDNFPHNHSWFMRNLMRFSSVIENNGTEVFRPLERPENWEWHACHMHYHSMKVFSKYEVIDSETRLLGVGHKASFCLEDNDCRPGSSPQFRCSNVADYKGTQGISPGCKDMYLHDFDCQWVDVTDIKEGKYTFQVSFNPEFRVPESNFFNNALTCELTLNINSAAIRNCKYIHIYDLL